MISEYKNPDIISPMCIGNGAHVVHSLLEKHLKGYKLFSYHPNFSLFPIILPFLTRKFSADLVHTTPDYAVFHPIGRVPLVITFHNYVLDRWMRNYASIAQKIHYMTDLKLFTKLALKKAEAITAVSHFTADLIRKDLGIVDPVTVIYNGIDEKKFIPSSKKKSPKKKINVFFSGNLTRRKGAHWLPKIARGISPHIDIYYTKGLRTKDFVSGRNNLHSIGRVPYKNMPDHYRKMDILLMPTVREGFGLAVAEAMACALPVVASNCSSIPELIDNENGGYLCPVGDVECFVEKINLLADSPKLRQEMGEYNRARVENMFTINKMIAGYRALFQKILQ